MSQRGGSVQAHIKIGGSKAPLVRRGTADVLIAFDRAEAIRNLLFVRPGGSVFVNSMNGLDTAIANRLEELGIAVHAIDADACARELGAPTVSSMVVLGLAAAHDGLGLSADDLKQAVRALGPAKAVELNVRALEMGAARA